MRNVLDLSSALNKLDMGLGYEFIHIVLTDGEDTSS
jgi:hypothetical protein